MEEELLVWLLIYTGGVDRRLSPRDIQDPPYTNSSRRQCCLHQLNQPSRHMEVERKVEDLHDMKRKKTSTSMNDGHSICNLTLIERPRGKDERQSNSY